MKNGEISIHERTALYTALRLVITDIQGKNLAEEAEREDAISRIASVVEGWAFDLATEEEARPAAIRIPPITVNLYMRDVVLVAAMLDGPQSERHNGTRRSPAERGVYFAGTWDQLVGVLYVVESTPTDDEREEFIIRQTSVQWRKQLLLDPTVKLPVPAWARAAPGPHVPTRIKVTEAEMDAQEQGIKDMQRRERDERDGVS